MAGDSKSFQGFIEIPETEDDLEAADDNHFDYNPETDIGINVGSFDKLVDQAYEKLKTYNSPPAIFQRENSLVKLIKGNDGIYKISNIEKGDFKYILSKCCGWKKFIEYQNSYKDASPPDDVLNAIYTRKVWDGIPKLSGICNSPIPRADGSIFYQHGYDELSGFYYAEGSDVPPIEEHPNQEAAIKAANFILAEVFGEFPIVDQASKANTLAGLLTLILRPMMKGHNIPLGVITKPLQGTGATMIVDIMSIIAFGFKAPTLDANCNSNAEWDKMLLSVLLEGMPIGNLDNLEKTHKLSNPVLSRFLTANSFAGRRLGKSEILSLQNNMALFVTGNNVMLGGDIPRRCYLVRLDAGSSQPWIHNKEFKHPDLEQWVKDHRGPLVVACLTMLAAWVQAGKPEPEIKALGSFEAWSKTIGGILEYAGIDSFL